MALQICDLYDERLIQERVTPAFENYYDVEFTQGFDMPVHRHKRIELMYVSKGRCAISVQDQDIALAGGEFMLINGDIPHRLFIEKGRTCCVLNMEFIFYTDADIPCSIKDLWTASLEVRRFLSSHKPFFHLADSGNLYITARNIIHELEAHEPGKDFLLPLNILELILKAARIYRQSEDENYSPVNVYVNKSLDYMRRHYSEALSVDDIAAALNLSTRYFQKIFKQVTGQTPIDYLNKLRMDKAKLLLQKTDIPLADLCLMVGINSRQYFSYLFKKYTGLTPSEFRESASVSMPSHWFSCPGF